MKQILILLTLVCLLLSGCGRSTTVILPPETTGTAAPETSTAETVSPDTGTDAPEPTTEATAPATEATESTVEPTKPQTPSTVQPTAAPTTAPTAAPTEPPTEPATEPENVDVYDISVHTVGSLEYAILSELNARRAAEDLPALTMDSKLCALAAIRAYESSLDPSHTRPDGRNWITVLSDYGFSGYSDAAENILYGSTNYTAAQIVDTWMKYASYKDNIMDPDFAKAGIGLCYSGSRVYIVNLLAG